MRNRNFAASKQSPLGGHRNARRRWGYPFPGNAGGGPGGRSKGRRDGSGVYRPSCDHTGSAGQGHARAPQPSEITHRKRLFVLPPPGGNIFNISFSLSLSPSLSSSLPLFLFLIAGLFRFVIDLLSICSHLLWVCFRLLGVCSFGV